MAGNVPFVPQRRTTTLPGLCREEAVQQLKERGFVTEHESGVWLLLNRSLYRKQKGLDPASDQFGQVALGRLGRSGWHIGIKLHCWGEWACFTRPEMKVERVSYDAMTPSAARGVVEAIYWKPEIRWQIDRITVLKPIVYFGSPQ